MKAQVLNLLMLIFLSTACSKDDNVGSGIGITQPFEGIITAKGLDNEIVEYFIKGDKVRVEGEDGILLYSLTGNTYIVLMPAEKVYQEGRTIDLGTFSEDALTGGGSMTKTGESKRMHGFQCEKWIGSYEGDQSEFWVTYELGISWAQLISPTVRHSDIPKEYEKLFIMKIGEVGGGAAFFEVTSIQTKALGEELFEVPAGYRKA